MMILDCTFRDGGYYTDWCFDADIVTQYKHTMDTCAVDYVEIGFRLTPKNEFLGPFAYSTDEFIKKIGIKKRIGVMLNASDFIGHTDNPSTIINSLFSNANESPVSLVRVATHFKQIQDCKPIVETLHKMGYIVGLNMMQSDGKSDAELRKNAENIKDWGCVNVLYFADSLGSMDSDSVERTYRAIRAGWDGDIGFHGHDNKGQSLVNSLKAEKLGCTWIDGTILGMGRGAGNTCTEQLLLEFGHSSDNEIRALFKLVNKFELLKKQYEWGCSLPYYLAASRDIHPTYIQEMKSLDCDIYQGIKNLSKSSSYNRNKLNNAIYGSSEPIQGTWSADGFLKGREVLILGSGPSISKHRNGIIDFINNIKPYVISLNSNTNIGYDFIDAYAVCNSTRLFTEMDEYKQQKKIIMPYNMLSEEQKKTISIDNVLDYGISIKENSFEIYDDRCVISNPLVAPYVFAAVTAAKANIIYLAGFDGYDDSRQNTMNNVIALYKKHDKSIQLIAVTPTSYQIKQSSVYSPRP